MIYLSFFNSARITSEKFNFRSFTKQLGSSLNDSEKESEDEYSWKSTGDMTEQTLKATMVATILGLWRNSDRSDSVRSILLSRLPLGNSA